MLVHGGAGDLGRQNRFVELGQQLIQILAETKKNNQTAGITGLSDHFKKIFNMVGITKFAKIYNTEEVALETLTAEPA